jgi:hypothetical protein
LVTHSLALATLQDGPAGGVSTSFGLATGGGDVSAKRGRTNNGSDTSSIYTESQA